MLFQGMHDGHDDGSGTRASGRLGSEAEFSGDDQRAQAALGIVVVGRNSAIMGPVIEAVRVLAEDALQVLDAWIAGFAVADADDLGFDGIGLGVVAWVVESLLPQAHGGRQLFDQGPAELPDFAVLREALFELFDIAFQVREAVLQVERQGDLPGRWNPLRHG